MGVGEQKSGIGSKESGTLGLSEDIRKTQGKVIEATVSMTTSAFLRE